MARKSDMLVLVTGASGYIGSHVAEQLVTAGYQVRGSVRDKRNEAKTAHLVKMGIELVEADLLKADSWCQAVSGCDFVMHVASPFPSAMPENENELINPALEGTRNVLNACLAEPTVRKVVLTSSVAAIIGGTRANKDLLTEDDWTNELEINAFPAYVKSKVRAERLAWEMIDQQLAERKLTMAVINPSIVIGPTLSATDSTSVSLAVRLLKREMPAVPHVDMAYVDVRDVAIAHVRAMEFDEANGNRHILNSGNVWLDEISKIAAQEFNVLGYNIPTMRLPDFCVTILGWFDPSIRIMKNFVSSQTRYSNARMRGVLKVTPIALEKTISDMMHSVIEVGLVSSTAKYNEQANK